jgi:hypothetical protein
MGKRKKQAWPVAATPRFRDSQTLPPATPLTSLFVPKHDAMIAMIVGIPIGRTIVRPGYDHLRTGRRHDHHRRRTTRDHRGAIRARESGRHDDLSWPDREERRWRRQERQPEGKSKRDTCVSRAGYGQPDSCDCESEKSFSFHTNIRRGLAGSVRFHSLLSTYYQ